MSSEKEGDRDELERRLEFVTTMEDWIAAMALISGRPRLSGRMWAILLLAIVAVGAIAGLLRMSVLVVLIPALIITAVVFTTFQIDPLVRWSARRYMSGLLGTDEVVEVRPSGISFQQGDITSKLPWTAYTSIKANDQAVVFLKGRTPLGVIPASAFETAASRDEFLALARSRIPAPS